MIYTAMFNQKMPCHIPSLIIPKPLSRSPFTHPKQYKSFKPSLQYITVQIHGQTCFFFWTYAGLTDLFYFCLAKQINARVLACCPTTNIIEYFLATKLFKLIDWKFGNCFSFVKGWVGEQMEDIFYKHDCG